MSDTAAPGGIALDNASDGIRTAVATMNPAIGPAIPMSNSADRERIAERIQINAPNVPINVGAGIKNGSVAYTP